MAYTMSVGSLTCCLTCLRLCGLLLELICLLELYRMNCSMDPSSSLPYAYIRHKNFYSVSDHLDQHPCLPEAFRIHNNPESFFLHGIYLTFSNHPISSNGALQIGQLISSDSMFTSEQESQNIMVTILTPLLR